MLVGNDMTVREVKNRTVDVEVKATEGILVSLLRWYLCCYVVEIDCCTQRS